MDLQKIIGTNIVRIRQLEGLNQTALANKIGLSRKQLCKIERGEVYPTADTIQRISEGLGVPVKEFFSDPENSVDLDIYTHSQRALEKLLPIISKMLVDGIIDDMVQSKLNKNEGLSVDAEAPGENKSSN